MGLRVTGGEHLHNQHVRWDTLSADQYRSWLYIHDCMKAAGFKIAAYHMAEIVRVVNHPKALRALGHAWHEYTASRKEV
jgi:hypothetical protein